MVDLDLIEKILDATEEDGFEKVHVKFRGTMQPLVARAWRDPARDVLHSRVLHKKEHAQYKESLRSL